MYQIGYDKGAFVGGQAINLTGWSDDDARDLVDITHTGTAGEQALLAGIHRASGSIQFNYQPGDVSDNFIAGAPTTITLATGGPPVARTIRIEKISKKSTVTGVVSCDLSYKSSVT